MRRSPRGPERDRRGAERRQHGDPVGRGIGMRQAAADRAAVAHRAIGDAARDAGHDLADPARHRTILDRRVRRAGADAHDAARDRNAGIVRQMAQVGDRVGLRQAQIEQRPQRLRAGARPRAGGEQASAPPASPSGGHRRRARASSPAGPRGRDRRQHARRTGRQVEHLRAERRQRVVDRVDDRAPAGRSRRSRRCPSGRRSSTGSGVSMWSSRTSGTSVVPGSR